jgi:SAM-dependent methyltransferase
MENLRKILTDYIENGELILSVTASNPRDKEKIQKLKIRPVLKKEELLYQTESFVGTKAYHKNISPDELPKFLVQSMTEDFKQLELESKAHRLTALVSKKGKVTIKEKRVKSDNSNIEEGSLVHNRQKKYILPDNEPVPFLVELGVQTPDGKVVKAKYDKFRQINRYLEFVRDVLPALESAAYSNNTEGSGKRTLNIIDFGCGKSYLTFALYYYLKVMNNYDIRVIGLDLKKDVIENCQALSDRLGYKDLKFLVGDISSYEGTDSADMVVTLHACDTATDYALAKAVKWNAKVILSVPCCQHEVNKQIACDELKPALKYGLIKERMSALFTDAIRANLLEQQGYDTQILEFIDIEHTPKNILIRAVKKGHMKYNSDKGNRNGLEAMMEFLNINPTLQKLL